METPMAPDDRIFEKALARHLRSQAEPERAADCADAETLAAYHERLLAPPELSAWKGHIPGCARCQDILAQLEATDQILVASAVETEQERVLAMPAQAQAAPGPAAQRPAAPVASISSSESASKRGRIAARNWRV